MTQNAKIADVLFHLHELRPAPRVADSLLYLVQQLAEELLTAEERITKLENLDNIRDALRTLYVKGHTAAEVDAADAVLKQFAGVSSDTVDPRIVKLEAERDAAQKRAAELKADLDSIARTIYTSKQDRFTYSVAFVVDEIKRLRRMLGFRD